MQFDLHLFMLLAEINHVIYFDQSQFLLSKTNEDRSTCRKVYYLNNPFMPTVPTFGVREIDVSRHNGGDVNYAERRQSLGHQILERWAKIGCENATAGKNGLNYQ